jgi:hypothetical protein
MQIPNPDRPDYRGLRVSVITYHSNTAYQTLSAAGYPLLLLLRKNLLIIANLGHVSLGEELREKRNGTYLWSEIES